MQPIGEGNKEERGRPPFPTAFPFWVGAIEFEPNDRTLEGMRHRRYPLFSVQYHPEASAGPHDSGYLFEEFRKLMG